jgi:beta-N-acetylhexosaminidase
MVSHNIVNCMDPDRPASLSKEVHRCLRENLGYEGVILTDALDMGAVQDYADGDIAVAALLAGNDILLICDYKTGIPAVLAAVEQGTVTEAQINEACCRVLTWKQALGLI